MHHTYSFAHDLTPHSPRHNTRMKENSLQTQDVIRWARPRFRTLIFSSDQEGKFDMTTVQRFKLMAN